MQGMPGRTRVACTSDTVASTRKEVGSAIRAMMSPLRTGGAFLKQHRRQHAVAIRFVVASSSTRRASVTS